MALAMTACSRPTDGYQVISRDSAYTADSSSCYTFKPDFHDSGAVYETAITARVDIRKMRSNKLSMDISVISPKHHIAVERVEFPLQYSRKQHIIDMSWPYRSNIHIPEDEGGIWTVCVEVRGQDASEAVQALGFSYKTNKTRRDG